MAPARKSNWSATPLDLLLLAVPCAIVLRYVGAWRNDTLLFIISAIAIVPLAGWMGRATEQLALRSGAGVGGFLNATFGECGGVDHCAGGAEQGSDRRGQGFDHGVDYRQPSPRARRVDSRRRRALPEADFQSDGGADFGDLVRPGRHRPDHPDYFSSRGCLAPGRWSLEAEQRLSLAIVLVLFLTYFFSLFFHLFTHRELFAGPSDPAGSRSPVASLAIHHRSDLRHGLHRMAK